MRKALADQALQRKRRTWPASGGWSLFNGSTVDTQRIAGFREAIKIVVWAEGH